MIVNNWAKWDAEHSTRKYSTVKVTNVDGINSYRGKNLRQLPNRSMISQQLAKHYSKAAIKSANKIKTAKGGRMSEGKSPVGVNKSTNKTVSQVVGGAKTSMVKTGSKASGKMHNFSKLAIKSALKGYK